MLKPSGTEVRVPAVVFALPSTSGLRIAGLTVLDRLLVAIHRAGAGPITVVSPGPLPKLRRAPALGISFETAATAPVLEGPVLLASANVLVQDRDLRRCLLTGTSLLSNDGTALPIGCSESAQSSVEVALETAPRLRAEGVACPVADARSARVAESRLWRSLTSASDGYVDKVFNRPCGRPLSKLLIYTPVSPNTVSVLSILIGLGAAWLFAQGHYWASLVGAVLFQISAIIDCVDGDLARVLFKESWLGKWLDIGGDQIVHISVFGGLALGAIRTGMGSVAVWLGISAMLGVVLSFAVVVRGMRHRGAANPMFQKLIDSATNRDFSVLILALAAVQQLELFLWMAAVGSHVFWILAISLQSRIKVGRRIRA